MFIVNDSYRYIAETPVLCVALQDQDGFRKWMDVSINESKDNPLTDMFWSPGGYLKTNN